MKKNFFSKGYLRALLLSVTAACAIECCVNADEVKDAFIAGKTASQQKAVTVKTYAAGFLKVPQKISNILGQAFALVDELTD